MKSHEIDNECERSYDKRVAERGRLDGCGADQRRVVLEHRDVVHWKRHNRDLQMDACEALVDDDCI